ncbi:hypothetical protein Hanom_Chr07g00643671 [Helianthus anomalus]
MDKRFQVNPTQFISSRSRFVQHEYIISQKSKMPFLSLRFGQFCNFRPKVCFPHLDTKGLKSWHFHPAR